MAPTRGLAATLLRFFDNSNLQHQPGVPPEERRVNAMAAALAYVTERDCDGVMFRLGNIVETVKGAKFWGEIIAFDADEASPGCTVLAIDPGFEGTKHVYPLKQLRHRLTETPVKVWTLEQIVLAPLMAANRLNAAAARESELLEANNRYQQQARDARQTLRQIADLKEFKHGSGVFDYSPALTAEQAQEMAFKAIGAGK